MDHTGTSRWRVPGLGLARWPDRRLACFAGYVVLLSLAFIVPIQDLVRHALKEELHSHALLIPFVCLYLAGIKWNSLPLEHGSSRPQAVALGLAAVFLLAAGSLMGRSGWSANDRLAWWCACFVVLLVAGGFLFLGRSWMRQLAFPFALLVFLVPLPDGAAAALEDVLMRASAVTADVLLQWTGTPVFRSGQVIELPGITLEVARECSGIRSSLVLFITSLIASQLFLSSSWHRVLLVAVVFPLGVLRNAMRVVVIGRLCVERGPQMIDSWIHHHGGPLFFAASLIPLLLLAVFLHRRESGSEFKL